MTPAFLPLLVELARAGALRRARTLAGVLGLVAGILVVVVFVWQGAAIARMVEGSPMALLGLTKDLLHQWEKLFEPPPDRSLLARIPLGLIWALGHFAIGLCMFAAVLLTWLVAKIIGLIFLIPFHQLLLGGVMGLMVAGGVIAGAERGLPDADREAMEGLTTSWDELVADLGQLRESGAKYGLDPTPVDPPVMGEIIAEAVRREVDSGKAFKVAAGLVHGARVAFETYSAAFDPVATSFADAAAKFRLANGKAQRCGRPGLLLFADDLSDVLETTRKLINEGRLDHAAELMTEVAEMTGDLDRNAEIPYQDAEEDRSSHGEPEIAELDAYEILGVEQTAPDGDIRRAYLRAVKEVNLDQRQDLSGYLRTSFEEHHKRINLAYEAIRRQRNIK